MPTVLTLNGGSSSIRFAVYEAAKEPRRLLWGKIDRIGLPGVVMTHGPADGAAAQQTLTVRDQREAAAFLLDWLESRGVFDGLAGCGHRVVNGLQHPGPERVAAQLLDELRRVTPFDPEHLPAEIALIEAVAARHPGLAQVACFDTAFHQTMPRVAKLLPLPRRFDGRGVQRYGFHGLSYSFLLEKLRALGDPAAAKGRVILAHLGNGASLAAVRDGLSIDTTMAFTPSAGLVMSTRSGDLDPGVCFYLLSEEQLTPQQFQTMTTHASGLLGVSETSSDVRDLLAAEGGDVRAAEALALFCYQAKKWLGAYAAALGGVDTLVFAGGIGENAPSIRARICAGLEFLGIRLDAARNAGNAAVISADGAAATVRVIATDEEWMMVRLVTQTLGLAEL